MLSPLISWFLSPSSSSSSEEEEKEEKEEQNLDIINTDESEYQKDNVEQDDNFLTSFDVNDSIPVALAVPNASPSVTVAFPAHDERNVAAATATATTIVTRFKRQRTGTVRQYQRLWTKQDEIELLKGYLDYLRHHPRATTTLQNDVASLYDHVRPKLNVDFNRNQLVEKLRRLKRKHKLALNKCKEKEVPFKSHEEQAIFEISHKIWGNDTIDQDALDGDESGRTPQSHHLVGNVKMKLEQVDNGDEIDNRAWKRSRLIDDDDDENRTNDQNNDDIANGIRDLVEETMRSCFSPLLKELLDKAQEEESIPVPLCLAEVGDEQRRKRRILELEVYLKRLGLLQDQIKAKLEELRSSSG